MKSLASFLWFSAGPTDDAVFSQENTDWLSLLFWLRQTGMPTKTMRHFANLYHAGDETISERKEVLLDHSKKLEKRRVDLDRCEEILVHKIAIYEALEE